MSFSRGRWRVAAFIFLILSTVGMAAATVATLLARQSYIFDLFTHFRPHYLIAAAILLGIAAALRRRFWMLALAGLAVPHVVSLADVARAPPASHNTAQLDVRILTFNVQYLNPHKDLVVDYVRRVQPDVILLQEVANGWQPTIERLRATHAFMVPAQPDFRGGNVTLSRHPILDGAALPLSFGGPSIVQTRISLHGTTLTVFNVHPLHPLTLGMADSQQRQFAQLAARRPDDGQPFVIAGDFNMTPWSPHFGDLLASTRTRLATHQRYWPSTWPANGSYGWLARRLRGLPIDHFLVSEGIAVVGVKRGPSLGSDHYPLLATLRLPPRKP